jgi:pimeloyl-ACP methyl ester carboxylesterase
VRPSPQKSTIVRTNTRPAARTDAAARRPDGRLTWVRRTFTVLERTAPALGGRWAWRLWTTPSRPDAKAVERSRAEGMGEVRTLRIELPDWTGRSPLGPDGAPKPPLATEVAVELLGPADGPTVYLLHGWGGWRGQFAPIGRALAARGYRAVLIDTPNHGDSGPGTLGGGQNLLPDFELALEAVARELGPAHAVVGHSLGGGCAALALLDGLDARRAVFIAPAVDPVAFTKVLGTMLGFGERIRTRMTRIGLRRTGHRLEEFILPERVAARADLPEALIVHDRDDSVVHIGNGRKLAAAWRESHLVETSGLGHSRILRDEAVVERVAAFIAGEPEPVGAGTVPRTAVCAHNAE